MLVAFTSIKPNKRMWSVEKEHPVYAEACHRLMPGESAYSVKPEILFDLHRYCDGWHVYWKNPPNGQIGRLLKTRRALISFLNGNWRVGTVLQTPTSEGMTYWKSSKRKQ